MDPKNTFQTVRDVGNPPFGSADLVDTSSLGEGLLDDSTCCVPARKCSRVACVNTCGVFICNDVSCPAGLVLPYHTSDVQSATDSSILLQNDDDIDVDCAIAGTMSFDVRDSCGQPISLSGLVQGQEFDAQGFNVIVAFATCNLPSSNGPGEHG